MFSPRFFTSLLFALTLAVFNGQAQEDLEFKETITGSYLVAGSQPKDGVLPKHVELTTSGGQLEARIKFKQAGNKYCEALYRFEWEFSEPIDRLYKDQTVNVHYRVTLVEGPCKADKGKMIVTSASGLSPQFKNTGLRVRPGLRVTNGKWISTGDDTASATAQLNVYNTTGPATLKLQLESSGLIGSSKLHYEVVYLFE